MGAGAKLLKRKRKEKTIKTIHQIILYKCRTEGRKCETCPLQHFFCPVPQIRTVDRLQ